MAKADASPGSCQSTPGLQRKVKARSREGVSRGQRRSWGCQSPRGLAPPHAITPPPEPHPLISVPSDSGHLRGGAAIAVANDISLQKHAGLAAAAGYGRRHGDRV